MKKLFQFDYLTRQETMGGESSLAYTYLVGSIEILIVCAFVGGLMLYYYFRRKHRSMVIYLPLSLFLIALFWVMTLDMVSLWRNYAWLNAISRVACGGFGIWTLLMLPSAIAQRRKYDEFDAMREELKKLREQAVELERINKELKPRDK